jgi:hypothetical protein
MTNRWYYRNEHTRRLSTGRTVSVRGSWALRGDRGSRKGASFRRTCPICGALIVSVGMPKGGWAHFEGDRGLTRIKHPCLHLGEGMCRRRVEDTPDLFEARL